MEEQQGFDDTNKGALFKNQKKTTDRHPDYNGSVDVEGTEYWLSAWLNVAKSGMKYMKLALTKKEEQIVRPEGEGVKPVMKTSEITPDEIPF
jgi:hypothetical protein